LHCGGLGFDCREVHSNRRLTWVSYLFVVLIQPN
jgi:hypothetical protein